jgi:hypothetical protein
MTRAERHALARAFLRITRNDIRDAIVRVVEAAADEHGSSSPIPTARICGKMQSPLDHAPWLGVASWE